MFRKKEGANMKIGKRLGLGFGVVCFLIIVVGGVGIKAVSDIVYQLEIAKIANRALVDTGDAETHALRLIIYKDEEYQNKMIEEINSVNQLANEAETLMLSESNKKNAQLISDNINNFEESANTWWNLEKSKDEIGKLRAQKAQTVISSIRDMIDGLLWPYLKEQIKNNDGKINGEELDKIVDAQAVRNSYNRVRIWAQKYQLALTPEKQDEVAQEWLNSIKITKEYLEKSKSNYDIEAGKKDHDVAIQALEEYQALVQDYREINKKQRAEQVIEKENAINTLEAGRTVRDGVYKYINKVEQKTWYYCIATIIFAVILGMVLAFLITNSIVKPVETVKNGLLELAKVTQGVAVILKDYLAAGNWSKKAHIAISDKIIEQFRGSAKCW